MGHSAAMWAFEQGAIVMGGFDAMQGDGVPLPCRGEALCAGGVLAQGFCEGLEEGEDRGGVLPVGLMADAFERNAGAVRDEGLGECGVFIAHGAAGGGVGLNEEGGTFDIGEDFFVVVTIEPRAFDEWGKNIGIETGEATGAEADGGGVASVAKAGCCVGLEIWKFDVGDSLG